MSELLADRIRASAQRLTLTHLAEEAETLAERAEATKLGYLEFLDLILQEEVGMREGRRFRNALKLSGLPHHKTLDAFDFAFQPELDPRTIRGLASLGFVQAKANVALLGPPGVGKPTSASRSPSPPAKPGSPSTSPPSTTSSVNSAKPKPPAGSPANYRPTSNPPSSYSTKSATCR